MTGAESHHRGSYRVLAAIVWLTALILGVKGWAGWSTRSLSLLAESLHTLIECSSMLLTLWTVSAAKPGARMDFRRSTHRPIVGHFVSDTKLLMGLIAFLGFAGVSLILLATQHLDGAYLLTHSSESSFSMSPDLLPQSDSGALDGIRFFLLPLLAVVILIEGCLALFVQYEARVLNSVLLRGQVRYQFRTLWRSALVFGGLLGASLGYTWLDPGLAIALTIWLVCHCWRVVQQQLPFLAEPMAIAPEAITQLARQVEGVTGCYRIQSRGLVGRQVMVEMHLWVRPDAMIVVPLIIERVEQILRDRYGPLQAKIYVKSDRRRSPHRVLERRR